MVTIQRAIAAAALAAAACTDFEDPAQVRDMRILGMRAEPPEVVVPYDPDNPTRIDIGALGQVEVCALVADPAERRGMRYTMSACRPTQNGRCGPDDSVYEIGSGEIDDPESSDEPVRMCATLSATAELVSVLMAAIDEDSFLGFGGISAQVTLEVTPDGGGETLYGFKRVRYAAQLPAERVANANPTVTGFAGLRRPTGERGRDFAVPLGRCGEIEPFPVAPNERVQLLPTEAEGARERYVVPTFEGGSRHFTENLTYQWHATEGDWSPFESGGTLDVAGNEPPIDSTWRAPDDPEVIGDGIDVRMWIVQRDERGGQAWYETCAHVAP
jgi:hypothetical protein